MIEDDKSFVAQPLDENLTIAARSDRRRVPDGFSHRPALHDPSPIVHQREHGIGDDTGGIVEEHIHASRACGT